MKYLDAGELGVQNARTTREADMTLERAARNLLLWYDHDERFLEMAAEYAAIVGITSEAYERDLIESLRTALSAKGDA
jgi:hypothetical protein